ncbi:MAG: globin [Alphaproteobacteria bacterium]|nr:globin [Alphaproteobacteria bacterium]
MDTSLIARSLELVAERGDPVPHVYARLFAQHPQMEKLFVRDTSGGVRGNMLTEALSAMLEFAGGDRYGGNLMRAEIVNHENLGVPREVFAVFYTTIRDTFAELLGAAWTNDIDAAWRDLLVRIDAALAR